MRITDAILLFCLFLILPMIKIDLKVGNLEAITKKKALYDRGMECAVDDAVSNLVEIDFVHNYQMNKDLAVHQFFRTLELNFGVRLNNLMKEKVRNYVPVVLITELDGYYILYQEEYMDNGKKYMRHCWSEKKAYTYVHKDCVINFTLTDYIRSYHLKTKEVYEGVYGELQQSYLADIFKDYNDFELARRSAIISLLKEDMKYYINYYNSIGKQFGIQYEFSLPNIKQEDWYRTIDDVSFMAIFQGYPYGVGTDDVYNRYAVAGARVYKKNMYYLQSKNGNRLYHRESCSELTNWEYRYNEKKNVRCLELLLVKFVSHKRCRRGMCCCKMIIWKAEY